MDQFKKKNMNYNDQMKRMFSQRKGITKFNSSISQH